MDFSEYIITPKNTASGAGLETKLILTRGVLNGGFIYFPTGPAGLLHVQIFHGDMQLAPANSGASFNLDNAVIPIGIFFTLDVPPYQVIIKTWNESTLYDHACTVALWLKEAKTGMPGASGTAKNYDSILNEVKARNNVS